MSDQATPPSGPPVSGPGPVPPSEPANTGARRAMLIGLTVAAALIVVVAAVLVPKVVDNLKADEAKSPEIGEPTMDDVVVVENLSNDHQDNKDLDYEHTPPLGGPHDSVWLACGVYDEPVREENMVHDLEHGTVWITYQPDLADEDVATLEDALPDDGIMSPYPDLPAPVVVTVWGVQLQLEGADDPRLAEFIDEYGDGHTSPEPFVTCEGGTPDPQGGQNADA